MKRTKHPKRKKADKGAIDLSILFGGDRRPKLERIRRIGVLGVMCEDLHSKMDQVIKVMEDMRTSLEREISDFREEVNERPRLMATRPDLTTMKPA